MHVQNNSSLSQRPAALQQALPSNDMKKTARNERLYHVLQTLQPMALIRANQSYRKLAAAGNLSEAAKIAFYTTTWRARPDLHGTLEEAESYAAFHVNHGDGARIDIVLKGQWFFVEYRGSDQYWELRNVRVASEFNHLIGRDVSTGCMQQGQSGSIVWYRC